MATRLSIALCTYNGERFLDAQLASLAEQSRLPLELVVSDDGSTDATLGVVRAFAREAPFLVRVLEPTHRVGPTQAFARTAAACTGDVVAFCDQDDRWYPDKVERLTAPFKDSAVTLAICNARLVGPDLAPTGRTLWEQVGFRPDGTRLKRPERVLLGRTIAFGLTMAVRNSLDMRRALWPIPPRWGHDGWSALVASGLGAVALVDEVLVDYRQHPGQVSSAGTTAGLADRLAPRNALLVPDALALQTLVNRLDEIDARGSDWQAVRDYARGKAAHLGFRESLPLGHLSVLGRARRIACEAQRGDYGRHSNGWHSVVRDLVWGPPR